MHDSTDVLPQFRVDGDDSLRQVSHVLHHPLITEIIREQLCPLAEQKQKTERSKSNQRSRVHAEVSLGFVIYNNKNFSTFMYMSM